MSKVEEYIEGKVKRKIEETLYESDKIEYLEIINKIMNKSHLVFIIDYDYYEKNKKYTIYIEEKIKDKEGKPLSITVATSII